MSDFNRQDATAETPGVALSPQDSAALDALLAADFQISRVEENLRDRAERVGQLLGLLDAPEVTCDRSLVDVTIQRIARQAEPELCAEDADALDAWAIADYDADRAPGSLRDRAARHETLAGIVRDSDIHATPLLVERTFQAVASRVAADRSQGLSMRASRGWRSADLISMAAMVLIGVSVLWPSFSYMGQKSRQIACKSNLASVASAMGHYAGDHRNEFPVATAGFGGTPWWNVSPEKPTSNAANLFTLARTGYSKLRDLACAGNPHADRGEVKPNTFDWANLESVSFSYQIMAGEARPNWRRDAGEPAKVVVLSDRSPVVLHAVKREVIDPMENSPNHDGRGQFVLLADGSVAWMSTPERGCGDNIWLPRAIEHMIRQAAKFHQTGRLEGFEFPEDVNDSFVGP